MGYAPKVSFAPDSALEESGFELTVPHHGRRFRDARPEGLNTLAALRQREEDFEPGTSSPHLYKHFAALIFGCIIEL
jgi:hypothetical protein